MPQMWLGFFYYFQISHSVYLKYLHSLFHNVIPVQESSHHHHYTHLHKFSALHFQVHWSWYVLQLMLSHAAALPTHKENIATLCLISCNKFSQLIL